MKEAQFLGGAAAEGGSKHCSLRARASHAENRPPFRLALASPVEFVPRQAPAVGRGGHSQGK